MNVLLLGPPGAGKGTQGTVLAEQLGVPKLATGDVLRDAVRAGTTLGREAAAFMNRGDLVPDSVILGIVKEELAKAPYARGVVLDGVVRTVPQAEGLARALGDLGRTLDAVVVFEVGEEELVRRLSGRTVCEGCQTPYTGREPGTTCEQCGGRLVRRTDDDPEAVRRRFQVYARQTEPVIAWYEADGNGGSGIGTCVVRVNAVGAIDDVTSRVQSGLARCRGSE
ncbi:MAG TPA: adenylate kinase [Gemmatimonadaceae bacterium]|nr:adenylate kinase [Gemmatimonadaceae bacterium]